jgi:hypothetical protein
MFCRQYDEALTTVALGAPADLEVVRHLKGCPACQARLEEARLAVAGMDRSLRTLLSVVPAADFTARVTIQAAEPCPRHSWIHWAAAAAACATVLIAAASVLDIINRASSVPAAQVSGSTAPVMSGLQAEVAAAVAADRPGAAAGTPSISLDRAVRRRSVRASRAAASSRVTQEVIVEPGQVRAVRRLVTAVAEGRFALEESLRDTAGSAIVPMIVQPIPVRQIEVLDEPALGLPALQGGE